MNACFVGFSKDDQIRYAATSGGLGTSLVKYLFESGQIQTCLSFRFNSDKLCYEPYWAYDFSEYQHTGSIYHEIDLVRFTKETIKDVKGNVLLFLLPCQVYPVQQFFAKRGVKAFIISLVCSAQQNYEATSYLLKRVGVHRNDVVFFKYRGDGWPSGIRIFLKNGQEKFIANNQSIWMDIFHSKLFILKKCFFCQESISQRADFVLADPWLKEYMASEKEGKTFIQVNTQEGMDILEKAKEISIAKISAQSFRDAQSFSIKKKKLYWENRKDIRKMMHLFQHKLYKCFALNSIGFKLHCMFLLYYERFFLVESKPSFNQIIGLFFKKGQRIFFRFFRKR